MKVKNNSKNKFCHAQLDKDYKLEMLLLAPNEIKEIPDEIAKNWIATGKVIQYIEPKDVKKIDAENKALKEELEKLKQEAKQETKPKATKTKKTEK
jgi:hypothetical protein